MAEENFRPEEEEETDFGLEELADLWESNWEGLERLDWKNLDAKTALNLRRCLEDTKKALAIIEEDELGRRILHNPAMANMLRKYPGERSH